MDWNSDNGVVQADEKRLLGDAHLRRDEARRTVADCDREICELEEAISHYDPAWLEAHRRSGLLPDGTIDPRDVIARLHHRADKQATADAEPLVQDLGEFDRYVANAANQPTCPEWASLAMAVVGDRAEGALRWFRARSTDFTAADVVRLAEMMEREEERQRLLEQQPPTVEGAFRNRLEEELEMLAVRTHRGGA